MIIDLELEAQILAAMLNNNDCLNIGLADIQESDFADTFFRHVYKTIRIMWDADEMVNSITVYEKIKEVAKGKGTTWMILKDAFWPAGTFDQLIVKLKKITKARQLLRLGQKITDGVNRREDPDDLAESMEADLYCLNSECQSDKIVTPQQQASSILETVANQMDEATRKKTSIYTSLKALNYQTGGLEAGDLVIVSGPTGGGKTAFTQNLIGDIAIMQKLPCLHINTEMSKKQMDIRWAAIIAKEYEVNNSTIRSGKISQEQYMSLVGQLDAMHRSELYSITIPDLTVPKMLSTIRRFVMQKKIRAVAIDYIGRVDTMNSDKDDWKQLLSAAKKLKTIGQQFGLVVFMVAQNDKSGNLAMASYMEHEADLHLHVRPLADVERGKFAPHWNYALVIKKGRSSPQGVIPVRFVGEKLKFVMDEQEAIKYAALANQQQKPGDHTETATHQRMAGNQGSGRNKQRKMPYDD
jgi:replicative DNA helicase